MEENTQPPTQAPQPINDVAPPPEPVAPAPPPEPVAPAPPAEADAPQPEAKKAEPEPKPVEAPRPPKPAQADGSNMTTAIVATVIIVLGLALLAVVAYLKTK